MPRYHPPVEGFHPREYDHLISIHFVPRVGRVAVLSLGGEPFGVVVEQESGYGLIWADRPEIGALEVLRALERRGSMSTPELCAYLHLRPRVVACHVRTLMGRGVIECVERIEDARRGSYGVYSARAERRGDEASLGADEKGEKR